MCDFFLVEGKWTAKWCKCMPHHPPSRALSAESTKGLDIDVASLRHFFFGKSTWSRVWAGNFNEIRDDTRSSGVVGAADKAKAIVTHSRQPEALIATPLPAFLADGIFFFHRYFSQRERHRNVSKWNRLVRALTWMSLADRLRREQEGGVVLHFGSVVVVTIRVTIRFCLRHSS